MSLIELGTSGAKRQTWTGSGARAILVKLRKKHPEASTEELAEKMLPALRRDEDALTQVATYWVQRNLSCLEPSSNSDGRERERARLDAAKRVAAAVKKTKSVLLITVMTSTFGELVTLANAGPKLLKISKMGKPNQRVSDVLTEAQVLKILDGK